MWNIRLTLLHHCCKKIRWDRFKISICDWFWNFSIKGEMNCGAIFKFWRCQNRLTRVRWHCQYRTQLVSGAVRRLPPRKQCLANLVNGMDSNCNWWSKTIIFTPKLGKMFIEPDIILKIHLKSKMKSENLNPKLKRKIRNYYRQ